MYPWVQHIQDVRGSQPSPSQTARQLAFAPVLKLEVGDRTIWREPMPRAERVAQLVREKEPQRGLGASGATQLMPR